MSDDDDFMQASDDEGYAKLCLFLEKLLTFPDTILSTKKMMKKKAAMSISRTNTIMRSR